MSITDGIDTKATGCGFQDIGNFMTARPRPDTGGKEQSVKRSLCFQPDRSACRYLKIKAFHRRGKRPGSVDR